MHVLDPMTGRCSCRERTGELVVFTCPICCEMALLHLEGLTDDGVAISIDKVGSVSALETGRDK